jgi:outer membrane protein OmpA-like peptidoglycan-associated protein
MRKALSHLYSATLICITISGCAGNLAVNSVNDSESQLYLALKSIQDYTYDYNQVVSSTANNDVHVICDNCAPASKLEREPRDVSIAIFWGKDQVATAMTGSRLDQRIITLATRPALKKVQVPQNESKETTLTNDKKSDPDTSCIIPPVLFDFNSDILKDTEKSKLLVSLPWLKKAKSISVKGYTCEKGSKEYNDGLALRRALAVARFLEDHGIKPSEVTGEGKCCYVSDDNSKNRRTEISCLKPKGE